MDVCGLHPEAEESERGVVDEDFVPSEVGLSPRRMRVEDGSDGVGVGGFVDDDGALNFLTTFHLKCAKDACGLYADVPKTARQGYEIEVP